MTTSQYLRAFVRFWWLLVLCAAIGVGAALLAADRDTPRYTASVTMGYGVTKAVPRTTGDFAGANALAVQRALTDASVADGNVLENETAKDSSSGDLTGRLSLDVATGTNVIVVTATGTSPQGAETLAVDAGQAMVRIATSLESRSSAGNPLLRARLVPNSLTPAEAVASTAGRDPLLFGLVGLLVGLALAVGLARLFPRLRDPKVTSQLAQAPVLGVLKRSAGAERYEQALAEIRTSIMFLREPEDTSLLVALTTPLPEGALGELARDLAAEMAATSARVLVLDANLKATGEASAPGLADYLTTSSPLRGLVATDPRGFDVMAAGRAVSHPADLLHHERFAALMASAAGRYDQVLVLTPPTSSGTGAPAAAGRCSATVIVVGDRTRARDLRECLRVLRTGATPVKGLVLLRGSPRGKGSRKAP